MRDLKRLKKRAKLRAPLRGGLIAGAMLLGLGRGDAFPTMIPFFASGGSSAKPVINVTYAANDASGRNLLNDAKNSGFASPVWNGTAPAIINVTINSGVVIGAPNTSTPAFTVPSGFPPGTKITITNYGHIVGAGGAGGNGSNFGTSTSGGQGGVALNAQFTVSIANVGSGCATSDGGGCIGGGGGGGGGGGYSSDGGGTKYGGGGGGGGAGAVPGAGGGGLNTGPTGDGAPPFAASGGGGGGGPGGGGGGLGAPGSAGSSPSGGGCKSGCTAGSSGGAAGYAIQGLSNLTWISGSSSPNVLGPTQ
jgi:hypothetical protein